MIVCHACRTPAKFNVEYECSNPECKNETFDEVPGANLLQDRVEKIVKGINGMITLLESLKEQLDEILENR